MEQHFGIGSSVWKFDERNRVYKSDENGRQRIDRRAMWVEYKVTGETHVSWVVGDFGGFKLSKKAVREGTYNVWPVRIALSLADIDRSEWVSDHRWRISQAVDALHDYEMLKRVALTIGYKG